MNGAPLGAGALRPMYRLCVFAALAAGIASAQAGDAEPAAGKLAVKGSVTLGTAYRSVSQDSDLVSNVNGSQVGIPGTAIFSSGLNARP